jgi:hypothetical protein
MKMEGKKDERKGLCQPLRSSSSSFIAHLSSLLFRFVDTARFSYNVRRVEGQRPAKALLVLYEGGEMRDAHAWRW